MPLSLPTTLAQVADALGLEYRGDGALEITGLATLAGAGEGQVSFLANPKYRAQLKDSRAAAVIVHPDLADECNGAALLSPQPYISFAKASGLFNQRPHVADDIHSSAQIHPSALIAENVSLAAGVNIAEGVRIGEGTRIGAGSSIGANSIIGDRCVIHANASLADDVHLGDDVVVNSGAVIGSDGFGHAPTAEGWQKIHQLGGVRIGNRVDIGANTTIDRGALEPTVIEDDVIIDNLCQIAHNVKIGAGTAMAGCAAIAGSSEIGKRCVIAGGVGIVGHIRIADGTHIGARALVSRSINEAGHFSSGTPLMDSAAWRKSAVRFSQLDDMSRRIRSLEKQLSQLDKNKPQSED